MSETLSINKIRTDGGTQPRVNLYEETVSEYADALHEGAEFPPVVVFHDGASYWLADGFHRFHAYRKAERDEIPAKVNQGTRRDAVLYSVGANSAHGLRRTNEDKRSAVETLLSDDEWRNQYSNYDMARICAVSESFVRSLRTKRSEETGEKQPTERTYTTKHGTEATMNTGNIGTQKLEEPIAEQETTALDKGVETPEQPTEQRQPQSKGVGLRMAYEAISALKRIPLNDGLRQDAFDKVIDWIETNRSN